MLETTNRVLVGDPTDLALLQTIDGVIESIGMEEGVSPYEPRVSDPVGPALTRHRWLEERENGAVIDLIDDRNTPARWISIRAAPGEGRRILDYLALFVSFATDDQLLKDASESKAGAFTRLALGSSSGESAAVAESIVRGLSHEDDEVRVDAVTAIAVLKWERFRSDLTSAIRDEVDDSVRRCMEAALAKCGA